MINDSTINGNHANPFGHSSGNGGGIANWGTLVLQNSTVSGNTGMGDGTGGQGGGIKNSGSLEVTNRTISGNTSTFGGGIYGGGTITSSTISSNTAQFEGAGIWGTATVSNSTISGNTTNTGGGGIYGGGTISNSTISNNAAPSNATGGIHAISSVQLKNTILKAGASGRNIGGTTVVSQGYNISSDNGGGFLTGPGDQINTDALLGPLGNNGGLTATHALLPGSPAIDTGDPSFTPPPSYDQRGFGYLRVYNGRIDIGSFEVQPFGSISPTPTATATATSTASPTATSTVTATATVSPTATATATATATGTPLARQTLPNRARRRSRRVIQSRATMASAIPTTVTGERLTWGLSRAEPPTWLPRSPLEWNLSTIPSR